MSTTSIDLEEQSCHREAWEEFAVQWYRHALRHEGVEGLAATIASHRSALTHDAICICEPQWFLALCLGTIDIHMPDQPREGVSPPPLWSLSCPRHQLSLIHISE